MNTRFWKLAGFFYFSLLLFSNVTVASELSEYFLSLVRQGENYKATTALNFKNQCDQALKKDTSTSSDIVIIPKNMIDLDKLSSSDRELINQWHLKWTMNLQAQVVQQSSLRVFQTISGYPQVFNLRWLMIHDKGDKPLEMRAAYDFVEWVRLSVGKESQVQLQLQIIGAKVNELSSRN